MGREEIACKLEIPPFRRLRRALKKLCKLDLMVKMKVLAQLSFLCSETEKT
jgi:hypothetical protein